MRAGPAGRDRASPSYGGFLPRFIRCNRGCIRGANLPPARTLSGVEQQRLVLLVEDDEATRAFLADNLAADGFRIAAASGAGEGLRTIEVPQPSLVVLDLVLEEGSGLD